MIQKGFHTKQSDIMLLLKQKPVLSSKYQYEISINWSRWHHLESQCKIARHQ